MEEFAERDARLARTPDHKYVLDGARGFNVGCTSLKSMFFEGFDREKQLAHAATGRNPTYAGMTRRQVLELWEGKRDKGTAVHAAFEHYLNAGGKAAHEDRLGALLREVPDEEHACRQFLGIEDTLLAEGWRCVRNEWKIFSEELDVAGELDSYWENGKGEGMIVDWKRTDKDFSRTYSPKFGFLPLNKVPSSELGKYSVQVNIYRAILEQAYGKRVVRCVLAQVAVPGEKGRIHEALELREEVRAMFAMNRRHRALARRVERGELLGNDGF